MVYIYKQDGVVKHVRDVRPDTTEIIELSRMIPMPRKVGFTSVLCADFETGRVWYDLLPDPTYTPPPNVESEFRELVRSMSYMVELTPSQLLSFRHVYDNWSDYIGATLEAGLRVLHDDRLYEVRQPVLVQSHQSPGSVGMEAIYSEINITNEGSLTDPIPYYTNMLLSVGKYYSQDGVIYLCIREIQAIHPLSALVGHYVEIAGNLPD